MQQEAPRRRRGGGGGGRARAPRSAADRGQAATRGVEANNIAARIADGAKRAAVAVINARRRGEKLKLKDACRELGGAGDFGQIRRDLSAQAAATKLQYQCLKGELRKMGLGGSGPKKPEDRYVKLIMKALGANSQANRIASDEGFGVQKVESLKEKARRKRDENIARARARQRN